ncbi:MAG: hypothetical protein F4186_08130 [Boseongicola sp. SB0676_bin_33]|nr:hypothetical protein [Boseongicola sp. SB0676_bin_33]
MTGEKCADIACIAADRLGRMGDLPLRRLFDEEHGSEFALPNVSCAKVRQHALLLEFDMVQGRRGCGIKARGDHLSVAGHAMRFTQFKEFRDLPLLEHGLDWSSAGRHSPDHVNAANLPGRRRSESRRLGAVDEQGHLEPCQRCQSRPLRPSRSLHRRCGALPDQRSSAKFPGVA